VTGSKRHIPWAAVGVAALPTAFALLAAATVLTTCSPVTPDGGGGYGSNRNWAGQYLRIHLTPEQGPLLGEYSSRNPSVIAQHVSWAKTAGIGFFAIPWRGEESWGHTTLADYLVGDSSFEQIDFCILYETPTLLGGSPDAATINLTLESRDLFLHHLLRLRELFFDQSNYLHLDGRPVLILRQSRRLTGEVRIALNALRVAYSDSTGGESLYLVGDEVTWPGIALPNGEHITALDAITGLDLGNFGVYDGYPAGTGLMTDLSAMWQQYALFAAGLTPPVPLFPSVLPGWNNRLHKPLQPVIPRQLSSGAISHTGTYDGFWNAASTATVVLLDSFNDWQRDTQIEPTADNGDANGTIIPTSLTGGRRYFPYGEDFIDATSADKGLLILGAIYEVWYDSVPPAG
jgi:hypothetical protein